MELVTGGEIFDRIEAGKLYSEAEATRVIRDVCSGLKHMHGKHIAHRDIKLENLLMESKAKDARVKLADFGFSRYVNDENASRARCGTAAYVAPETVRNEGLFCSVDMWAVGVVLYVLLSGEFPFDDNNLEQEDHFRNVLRGTYPLPSQPFNNVSDQCKSLIARMIEVDRNKRLTADQALADCWFEEAVDSTEAAVVNSSSPAQPRRESSPTVVIRKRKNSKIGELVFDAPRELQGQELYDRLYENGYHSDLTRTHGTWLQLEMLSMNSNLSSRSGAPIRSVLDVGCSHGLTVHRLWAANFCASGVDISAVAIAAATKARLADERPCWLVSSKAQICRAPTAGPRCVGECFQRSSATALPFADRSFDALLSSDVLEHLEPADVPRAARELARVTRRLLFLKIANRPEGNTADLQRLQSEGHAVPKQLHATVQTERFWLHAFRQAGFRLHHRLEDAPRWAWLKRASWMCCSFVLERVANEVERRPRRTAR